jgi:hypothetical protein
MIGENFVVLTGQITYPNLKTVGMNNTSLLNAKLAVPTDTGKSQYVKVAAWGTTAEAIAELPKDTFIKVHGHIEERSYYGKCRHCRGYSKVYWTNVVVDNFMIVEE